MQTRVLSNLLHRLVTHHFMSRSAGILMQMSRKLTPHFHILTQSPNLLISSPSSPSLYIDNLSIFLLLSSSQKSVSKEIAMSTKPLVLRRLYLP